MSSNQGAHTSLTLAQCFSAQPGKHKLCMICPLTCHACALEGDPLHAQEGLMQAADSALDSAQQHSLVFWDLIVQVHT